MRRTTAIAAPRPRIVAYIRVSTDKQAEHGVSLDAQRAKVTQYAELYDLDLVAIEVDALTAKHLDRPALVRALTMLDAGTADGLLVAFRWCVGVACAKRRCSPCWTQSQVPLPCRQPHLCTGAAVPSAEAHSAAARTSCEKPLPCQISPKSKSAWL